MNVHERFKDYNKPHCWQYEIRVQNKPEDLKNANMTEEESRALKISDFKFDFVPKDDKEKCDEVKQFIKKHEWLGKMPIWITHRFTARLIKDNTLAGVIIMATPNTFSNLLGKENKNLEKLISRGACISWSPKNTASWMIMSSIKWMVKNTEFRCFTAYSDPEAKELGTIYQSCNFTYLGQNFGTGSQYLDPNNPDRGWFGDSGFSDRSQIVRYAKGLGITWEKEWYKMVGAKKNYRKVNWKTIPEAIALRLKSERTKHKERCSKRPAPSKHKYCYVLGTNKSETKKLKKLFIDNNPDKINLIYPKNRGK